MPCKWPGNSFRACILRAADTPTVCCARRGLTQFHTYFNTGKTVRKLRDMHKRLCKLGYKMGIARPVSRARPLHAKSFRAGLLPGAFFPDNRDRYIRISYSSGNP